MSDRMSDERLAELKRLLETADYKIYTHSKELVAGMEAERAKVEELEAKLERVGELPKSWMPVLTSNENGQITATRRVLTPGQCAIELQAALKEERT